jgi:CheY-like chemotaxis protein
LAAAREATADGCDAQIAKPFRRDEVLTMLQRLRPGVPHENQSAARLEEMPRAEALPSKKLRLLVAEDNVVNQRIAVRVLERLGYVVDVVADGAQAVAACERERYAAVLMDCQMPDVDGFEATRRIRSLADDRLRTLPIIAMTANALAGDRERCLAAGMDDYLTKPIDREALRVCLEGWLARGSAA